MAIVDLNPIFEKLSTLPILAFEDGDIVLAEGSKTGRLLFMIQGAVDVVKDDWPIARVSERGAVFGEMAVLLDRPHTASVLAVQPSSFYVVDDAETFLRNEPLVALYVAVVQSGRLDAVNHHLIEAHNRIVTAGQRPGLLGEFLDKIAGALHMPGSRST